jgi:hypothetical protein
MYNNENNEELTQYEKIMVIMFRHYKNRDEIKWWRASDFQKEMFGLFIGYEASARMSEIVKSFPFAFEVRRNGRFREIKFNFSNAQNIYKQLPHVLAKHLVRESIIQ